MAVWAILRPFAPWLAGVLVISNLAAFGYGYHRGAMSEKSAQVSDIKEGIKVHGKIEQKVNSLSDADLDKRAMRWVRGAKR